jgi:hypothetical protein
MTYPFDSLHFFFIGILAVGSADLPVAFGVEFGVLISRSGAVCFEKSEGSHVVGAAGLVLVEN